MPPLAKYQTTLDKNTWHHVAVVIKDKTPYIYLNGTLVHTGLQAKKEHVFISNSIGGGPYGAFTGYLDEVRLIGRDLTASEIQDLMNRNDCYNR